MKRYDSNFSKLAFPHDNLVDVEINDPQLYASPTQVDKTYFKPGVPDVLQSFGSTRVPLFDSDANGNIPPQAVSLAYIRSPARDRTEIDYALEVVRQAVEKAKKEDESNIKDIQKSEKALETVKKTISEAIAENSESETTNK